VVRRFRHLLPVAILALVVGLLLPLNTVVYATSTETLRPSGVGSETSISIQYPASTYHWDKIDETTADDSSTYLRTDKATYQRDLFAVANHTAGSGTINSITIYFRVTLGSGATEYRTGYAKPSLKTNGTVVDGTQVSANNNVWTNHSETWTTNPVTTVAWTWADIDNLEIGISLNSALADWQLADCTQVYVVITYTPVTSPSITTTNATYVSATSARLNSYLTSDGGEACDVRFQYGLATGNYTYSTDWVNDTYTTGMSPYVDVTTLTTNTTYYFRAQAANSVGTANGSELNFTTTNETGAPTNLTAYPSDTSVSLTWVKGSGSTNTLIQRLIGSYPTSNTTPSAIDVGAAAINRASTCGSGITLIGLDNPANANGTITTIQVWAFSNITGFRVGTFYLVANTTYKCRASTTIGNITSGSVQTFTNLTINVIAGDYVGCYLGSGGVEQDTSGYAGICYISGDYTSPGTQATYTLQSGAAISLHGIGTRISTTFTGTQVYFGSMATATDTGLTPGTSYYYSAWGESGGTYSATYATVMTTTSAGAGVPGVPGTPEMPGGWFGAPDYTRLSGLPFYSVVNDLANDYGMPPTSFWLFIMLFGATLMGLFVYHLSQSAVASIVASGVVLVVLLYSLGGLLWIVFAVGIIATGVFVAVRQT